MTEFDDPSPRTLLEFLHSRGGDAVRSLVRYDGTDTTAYYVRDDIEADAARARLARVAELYRSERAVLAADPADPEFGRLHASVHVFGGAVVVHLLDPTGVAYGFSLEHQSGGTLLGFVRDCAEALYGEVPDDFVVV
jgi:hypothetical protein